MKRLVIELDKNGKVLNIFGDEKPEILIFDNREYIPEDSPKQDYVDDIISSVPVVLYATNKNGYSII